MAKIATTNFGTLALLPVVARVPLVESLSFLSDSIEHYDGTEQQIQLRSKARQQLRYELPVKSSNDPDAFNTIWGAIRDKWAVPVWCDAQYVGNVAANATSIVCDTVNYDLRANSLAMLFDGCGNWQILETTSITGTAINFSTLAKKFRGAMLIPVRIGFIIGDVGRPINGFTGKVTVNFQVDDTKEFTPDAPAQYLSNDIYYTPGLLEGDPVDTSIKKQQDLIDFDLGKIDRRSHWKTSKYGRNYRSIMVTPAERKAFKDFVYRRIGKVRPFWMPTFENNFRVRNTGTVVSTLVVNKDSFIDYAATRTHVAIEAGGVWYPRVISNPTPIDSDTMQLTLSSALNIPANSISRVSYLTLHRLDTDSFEINYTGPKVAECAVRILEIAT